MRDTVKVRYFTNGRRFSDLVPSDLISTKLRAVSLTLRYRVFKNVLLILLLWNATISDVPSIDGRCVFFFLHQGTPPTRSSFFYFWVSSQFKSRESPRALDIVVAVSFLHRFFLLGLSYTVYANFPCVLHFTLTYYR